MSRLIALAILMIFPQAIPVYAKQIQTHKEPPNFSQENGIFQFNKGMTFYYGRQGEQVDYELARYWFEKAANNNVPEAQFNLGVLYLKGLGTPVNTSAAMKWFQKAAELNLQQAQFNIGVAYLEGEGVSRDTNNAVYWLKRSALSGDSKSEFKLGLIYYLDQYGIQDKSYAQEWFEKSASKGNPKALFALAVLLESENSIEHTVKARDLFSQSCDQGILLACEQRKRIDLMYPILLK